MAGQIPKPLVDDDSRAFWEGLQKGELLIQQCDHCGKSIFYPRSICPHCFSQQISWIRASGEGRIYSYTVVHKAFGPFAEETPFVVAIIELDEGVRMMSRIKGDRNEIAIDKRVVVAFEQVDDDMTLPYFTLV